MQDNSRIQLSVVIPAYNEEQRLPRTLDDVLSYLANQPYKSEVIVADDGSTDDTAKIVQSRAGGAVPLRLVQHADGRNHGKGAAVRRGMMEATGEYRLFMDADNSTTINHVEQFWPLFNEGYNVVIGSRGLKDSIIPVKQPWYRRLSGNIGNLIIRGLAVPGVHDTQAGFKMFTETCAKDVFPRLTIDRWGFDIEILAVARSLNYRIKEVPIKWVNDPNSKVKASAYLEVFGEVWRVRRNLRSGVYR
jgi:dolichyl-phosphate beta-glucosyltransferase